MVRVFYSHLGEEELRNIENGLEEYDFNGKIEDLLNIINSNHPGFKNLILNTKNKLLPSAKIYKNVIVEEEKILDCEDTYVINDLNDEISENETLLISIYNPKIFTELFEQTLKHPQLDLTYKDPKRSEQLPLEFKTFLDDIEGPIEEGIKSFEKGECTLKELMVTSDEGITINFNETEDVTKIFDRKTSNVLPEALIKSIQKIWELDNYESNLYLHQEDCLFYILGKLKKPEKVKGDSLLLTIPTGGGKTEAFLIPIISYVYEKKNLNIKKGLKPQNKISAIITYPTKALANDQAERIISILHELNMNTNPHQKVTIGVLTGDTPRRGGWELKSNSIVQVCPNCGSSNLEYLETETSNGKKQYIKCKHCGNELDFIILTREDILNFPPDLLITNLDMINYCLQSPKMRSLFKHDKLELDLMVFDEVHLCQSVFGCHTGHLLRRLEATNGKKPLYIGVSATIANAEDLASLIFNVPKNDILYLNENNRPYLRNEIDHRRYHYILTPQKWKNRYAQVVTTALNTVDFMGHAIKDPHFRKSIVFSNFRQDTDNLVKYLRDQEDRYYKVYKDEIQQKLLFKEDLNYAERKIAESIGGWYEYLSGNNSLYAPSLEVGWHRGGLEQKERLRAVTRFSTSKKLNINQYTNEFPVDIMMATNTLELGIDIGDVSNVLNCSSPFTVNEYVQRAGRGGRKNDSTTMTVIDPTNPLDFYLKTHFGEYVIPEKRKFEDAPIIITNKSIRDTHMHARILEFVADNLLEDSLYKTDIKVEDLWDLKINHRGELIEFDKDPEIIGEIIFETMLKENVILDSNKTETTALEQYKSWFKLEHDLLNVEMVKINDEMIKEVLINKCRELKDNISSEEFGPYDTLTGLRPVDNTLVPKLRGSGPICNINLIRESGNEIKDYVNRRRVMTNMPPGGFATQGANTFIVEDIERDPETEKEVRNLLLEENNKAFDFFAKYFEEFFPNKVLDLDLRTPQNLKVRYFPFRFYCPKCGKTYTKAVDDDRCINCGYELRQLTEIYMCENCGEIFEPPVPKVCINPQHLKENKKFLESLNTPGRPKPKYDLFEFRALPELHWQCKQCKTTFNFHQKWSIDLPQDFINKRFGCDLSFDKPQDVAKHYQYRPESVICVKNKYTKRYNAAKYSCDKCSKGPIKAKNVPTVRCSLLEYIMNHNDIMEKETLDIGQITFKNVDVISLSREYVRRFYAKDSLETKNSEIFPGHKNSFLANTFSTQAAYLSINSGLIDDFINTQEFCLSEDCSNCDLIKKVQDNNVTKPELELEEWELNKKPDIRLKWCKTIRDQKCENEYCGGCSDFVRRDYLKYLLLHALKHALILSMPKYLGINKNEIRGIIYPNGKEKPELVFLDVHEDGSGSIYLMKRNWDKIWALSEELIKNAMNGRGTLLLPQFCERHNKDLCPVIGANFYEYIKKVIQDE